MKGYTHCLVLLAQCVLMLMGYASGHPFSVCGNGETWPHATDCHLYMECSFGEHLIRECPGVLHFNNAEKVCDYPSSAGCQFNVNPTTNEPIQQTLPTTTEPQTTTSTESSITPPSQPETTPTDTKPTTDDDDDDDDDDENASDPINDCHDVDTDRLTLPHPQCDHFYLCFNGNAYESTCMYGYHWNIEKNKCDLPSAAQCIDGAAPEQPGAIPVPTEETEPPTETLAPTTTEIKSTLPPRSTSKWTTTTRQPKIFNFVA